MRHTPQMWFITGAKLQSTGQTRCRVTSRIDICSFARSFLFLTGTCLLISCANSQQKAARHLEQAEYWAEKGKIGEATVEYRRAIQLDPSSSKAHIALAKIFMDRQDYASAFQQLKGVQKSAPENHEGQLMIADLTFRTGNFAEAEKEAQALIHENPNDADALTILAESALATKDAKLAESTTDRVLQVDAKNSRAWYLKATLERLDGKNSESEASLRNAIEYKPDSVPPVIALAALLIQRGDGAEAETLIRQSLARNPTNVPMHYLLGAFLMDQGRSYEAEEMFQQIKTLDDSDSSDRGALARYYFVCGNTEAAEKEYRDVIKKHPDDLQNALQLVALYVQLGRTSDGEQLIDEINKQSPNDPRVLLFRGWLRVERGQIEDGIRDLLRAREMQPQWALAEYFLGLAYIWDGKPDLASDALGSAARLDENLIPPRIALAQLALNQGKPDAAIAAIEKALEEKPQVVEPYLLRSLALEQEGQYAEAEKDALPLIDEFPQPAARALTFRTLALVEFQRKRFEDARKYAEESLKYAPTSQESLYLLGTSYIALNRTDSGLALVESYARSNPTWAPGYDILGQLQAMAGRTDDAERSFQRAIETDPKLDDARLRLSNVEVKEGKLDQAMNLLSKLAQDEPRMAVAEVRMGQICEAEEDWKGAEGHYSKALEIDSGNLVAKNNLAWIYAEHGGNIDVGLKLAQEAKEAEPDSMDISDTLAWILIKKQSYVTAIQLLQDCVLRDPNDPTFNYHLGVAYYRSGRRTQAEQYLTRALRLRPHFQYAEDANQILRVLKE